MKNICLISTGGTIASKRNPDTGLLTAGLMTGKELAGKCDLPKDINLTVTSVFQIPSNRMDFHYLVELKEKIEEVFLDDKIDGIVITHGTDTLEETSYFLDLTINDKRPLVVTGSQRGPEDIGSDAFVNLRQSIILAASNTALDLCTLVLFNEKIFNAKYVEKVHSSNVDGFNSPGIGYLGIVDGEEVNFFQKSNKVEHYKIKEELPEIEIVKCSLGSSDIFIKYALQTNVQGIIIEGFGRGHIPPKLMDSVKHAIKEDVVIVITTCSHEGKVKEIYDFPGSLYDLKKSGVILGGDYNSKKARIKLAVLLSAKENTEGKFEI